jgi:hypothetical protein
MHKNKKLIHNSLIDKISSQLDLIVSTIVSWQMPISYCFSVGFNYVASF